MKKGKRRMRMMREREQSKEHKRNDRPLCLCLSGLLHVKSNLFSNYESCSLNITSICFLTDLCCSVKIQKITVPSVVKMDYNLNLSERPNLSAPEFTLDCEYEVNDDESGLVIKWFLNNQLVYQWIPPRLPTALSLLKNRIKKNFTVSDDPIKKYRGVAVTKPMLNFSGEYMCSVQTFQSSDKKSSFLQIIGEFNLSSNLKGTRALIYNQQEQSQAMWIRSQIGHC
jgi:hypothetical protein